MSGRNPGTASAQWWRRLVESNVNVKVVQKVLGHKDVSTTLDIYTDVTKELARREFEDLDEKLKENMESARRGLRDSNSGENA